MEWLEAEDSHTVVPARNVIDTLNKEIGDVVQVIEKGTKKVFLAKL